LSNLSKIFEASQIEELRPSSDPEVWKFLGIEDRADPTQIAQRWAREKKVPHLKVGGRFKFSLPTLKAWAAAQLSDSCAVSAAQTSGAQTQDQSLTATV
jgi:hypothetical protein